MNLGAEEQAVCSLEKQKPGSVSTPRAESLGKSSRRVAAKWDTVLPQQASAPKSDKDADINSYFASRLAGRGNRPSIKQEILGCACQVWKQWSVDITRAGPMTNPFLRGPNAEMGTKSYHLFRGLSNSFSREETPAIAMRLHAWLRNGLATKIWERGLITSTAAESSKQKLASEPMTLSPEELQLTWADVPDRWADCGGIAENTKNHGQNDDDDGEEWKNKENENPNEEPKTKKKKTGKAWNNTIAGWGDKIPFNYPTFPLWATGTSKGLFLYRALPGNSWTQEHLFFHRNS